MISRSASRAARGLALATLVAAPLALGLDPGRAVTQYVLDTWDSRNGLPNDAVSALLQTRDGYLWVATRKGLSRFDGARFVTLTAQSTPRLQSDDVRCLLEDGEGRLWGGTNGGLFRFGRDGLRWWTAAADGLPSDEVRALGRSRDGRIWAGTTAGLCAIVEDRVEPAPPSVAGLAGAWVEAVHGAPDGSVWVGLRTGGIVRFDPSRGLVLDVGSGASRPSGVWSFADDRAGGVWIGEREGLSRWAQGQRRREAAVTGLEAWTLALLQDRDGNLWVATEGQGLLRLSRGTVERLTTRAGLANAAVRAVAEDREGSLWVGTAGGLHRLRSGPVVPYGEAEGLPQPLTWSVYEDRSGALWVGTIGGGVARFSGGRFDRFGVADGLPDADVCSIGETPDGRLVVGTNRGPAALERGRFRPWAAGGATPAGGLGATRIHTAANGDVWTATAGRGVARLSNGVLTPFTTREGLPHSMVFAVVSGQNGRVWAGTRRGLGLLQGTRFTPVRGLEDDWIWGLSEGRDDRDVLWVATGNRGVCRLRREAVACAGPELGLPAAVYAALEDAHGDLWLSSDDGIFRLSRSEALGPWERSTVLRPSVLGRTDGMRSAECSGGAQPAAVLARDGRLWFPTAAGVVAVDPRLLGRGGPAPPVLVEEAVADGRRLREGPGPEPLVLVPGCRRLEIAFTALSLSDPRRLGFRYRLDGYDPDWITPPAGAPRTAVYTTLPPGTYTFRVSARLDAGAWTDAAIPLPVTQRAFVYQTRAFQVGVAVALVLLGAGVQRWRVRRLRERQAELERTVDERTESLRAANERLRSAEARVSSLLASSPAASESVAEWAQAVSVEIAAAVGAESIAVWEVDRDVLSPLSAGPGDEPRPSFAAGADDRALEELKSAFGLARPFVPRGKETLVPVSGPNGELCGALVVSGDAQAWGEAERRLLAGFAHQLGGALEIGRMRRQLAAAEEKRAATRREMHARGIATLQTCPRCGRCYDHRAPACERDGSLLDSPRAWPYRFLDRYRFLRVLGQGGMGMVLAAEDERLGREVAVKLVRPEHFGNRDLVARFEREARAVARIQHPGVVALFDSGELPDGTAYLVMEKLPGRDLASLLEERGRGRRREVAALLRQGGAALGAAHRAGVVHRDVKPENLVLSFERGAVHVKVLDFGLATSMVYEEGLTRTGMVVGTPTYMAPEQLQGGTVDARADVYSFAAVCYEALTRQRVARGSSLGEVLANVLNGVAPPVSALVPGVTKAVDAAFAEALVKEPGWRPREIEPWATSLAAELEAGPEDATVAGWTAGRRGASTSSPSP